MLKRSLYAGGLLLVAALFCLATALTLARNWVSALEDYLPQIEAAASKALQREVSVGSMRATWRGLSPVILLRDVQVAAEGGQRFTVREARISLDVLHYLARQEIAFSAIDIAGIDLSLVRDADGRFYFEQFGPAISGNLAALLAIPRATLHDASISFIDRRETGVSLRIEGLRLSLRNPGDRLVLSGFASLSGERGSRLEIAAEFPGESLDHGDLQGRVYARVKSLELPGRFERYLPADSRLEGFGDIRLWADVASSRLTGLIGEVDLEAVSFVRTGAAYTGSFVADNLSGQFAWRRSATGWQFTLPRLVITAAGQRRSTERLVLASQQAPGGNYLSAAAASVSLDGFTDLLQAVPVAAGAAVERLRRLQPRGQLRGVQALLEIRDDGLRLHQVSCGFSDLGWEQADDMPRLSGLDGRIAGTGESGTLTLTTRDAGYVDTRLFRGILPLDSVDGVLHWHAGPGGLAIAGDDLRVSNRDLSLVARLTLDLPTAAAPMLDLELDLAHASLDRVAYYLPARVMPASGVAWLDSSLQRGEINHGTLRINGRLDRLPFDDGEGVLEARLPVTGARLDFHPQWSAVTGLDAQVNFSGRSLDITSRSGAIRSARLVQVHARIDDLARPELRIQGSVQGELQVMLDELGSSALGDSYGGLVDGIRTGGHAGLDLDIFIPLHQDDSDVDVAGTLALQGNTLRVVEADVALQALQGRLEFDNDGVRGKGLAARLFGKRASIRVWSEPGDAAYIQLDGRFALLDRFAADAALLREAATGSSDWRILLAVRGLPARGGRADIGLTVSSPLTGIAVKLPAPLGKPAAAGRPLTLAIDRLGARDKRLHFAYGDVLHGLLLLQGDGATLRVQRGAFALGGGEPELPQGGVLLIGGKLAEVNLGDWLPWLKVTGAGTSVPVETDLQLERVRLPGWQFADVKLAMQRVGAGREIRLEGPEIAGAIRLQEQGGRLERVELDLERLRLRPAESGQPPDGVELSPDAMPDLQVTIGKLFYGDALLGRVELEAGKNAPGAVAIRRLTLVSPVLVLNADGVWKADGGRQITAIDLHIKSDEMEDLLQLFGYQKSIRDGKLSGAMQANWPGPPWAFSAQHSNGEVSLKIRDGQLVDLEPGATGRVLGLLSVSALPRRLTLDFSDLFADGFKFDVIEGSFLVDSGNAYTNDLTVDGPAARIEVSGRVGLVDRDYDQLVTVTPYLRSGLPLAGALAGGPVVGAVLLVAERLLQDELDSLNRLARKRYSVTGSWSDPQMTRLDAPNTGAAKDDGTAAGGYVNPEE